MIKIELHVGKTIICKGLSSDPDPRRENWMLCQMADEDLQEVYIKNIKHVSSWEPTL